MASIAIMVGGAVVNAALSLRAIIWQGRLEVATKLPLKKKSATTKLSRLTMCLTPNTRMTTPNFSTGLRQTRK